MAAAELQQQESPHNSEQQDASLAVPKFDHAATDSTATEVRSTAPEHLDADATPTSGTPAVAASVGDAVDDVTDSCTESNVADIFTDSSTAVQGTAAAVAAMPAVELSTQQGVQQQQAQSHSEL